MKQYILFIALSLSAYAQGMQTAFPYEIQQYMHNPQYVDGAWLGTDSQGNSIKWSHNSGWYKWDLESHNWKTVKSWEINTIQDSRRASQPPRSSRHHSTIRSNDGAGDPDDNHSWSGARRRRWQPTKWQGILITGGVITALVVLKKIWNKRQSRIRQSRIALEKLLQEAQEFLTKIQPAYLALFVADDEKLAAELSKMPYYADFCVNTVNIITRIQVILRAIEEVLKKNSAHDKLSKNRDELTQVLNKLITLNNKIKHFDPLIRLTQELQRVETENQKELLTKLDVKDMRTYVHILMEQESESLKDRCERLWADIHVLAVLSDQLQKASVYSVEKHGALIEKSNIIIQKLIALQTIITQKN